MLRLSLKNTRCYKFLCSFHICQQGFSLTSMISCCIASSCICFECFLQNTRFDDQRSFDDEMKKDVLSKDSKTVTSGVEQSATKTTLRLEEHGRSSSNAMYSMINNYLSRKQSIRSKPDASTSSEQESSLCNMVTYKSAKRT